MKRNITTLLSAVCTIILFVSTLAANDKQAPLTGTWECQAKGGSMGDMPFTLDLKQTGEKVEGTVSAAEGGTEISSRTFKDNILEIHINTSDANYVLKAKLDRGVLSGSWANGDDKGTWEGKKKASGPE